ncbi:MULTISPECIES: STAS domain-containing protein [unclassified Aeromicrobium]|uniref:STAS domain-containing protein n=1 Tax=unclassified Aeromicrobium TaxID=2633570 RepID=UPI00396B0D9E
MQTDFQFSCDPPKAQMRIVGELDPSTTAHLADVLESLATRGCTRVEVNVEEVSYVDKSNLRVLRAEQLRLRSDDGDLVVVGGSDYHRVVARHAGCTELFPSAAAEDAASREGVGS